MRVTPWNQYPLVDKEFDLDIQLASGKNGLVCGCPFFVCVYHPSARLESPCHLKVGPVQNQEVLPGPAVFCEGKDLPRSDDGDGDNSSVRKIISLKSSLKKPIDLSVTATAGGGCTKDLSVTATAGGGCTKDLSVTATAGGGCTKYHTGFCVKNGDAACQTERRKAQWTDTSGGELFHVREFEMRKMDQTINFIIATKRLLLAI